MSQFRDLKTTDFFSSADAFITWPRKENAVYELMCHPGHDNHKYQNEMANIQAYLSQKPLDVLMSYNDL